MIKKNICLNLIIIFLVSPHYCSALDVLEKELLKKNPHSKNIESEEKQKTNPAKTKISPMPNHFFKDQDAVNFYRDSLNPTNEEGLLDYFNKADDLSVKTFKKPKSEDYLPPSSDDVRGFKIYKKSKNDEKHNEKITIPTKEENQTHKQPQKMFSSQNIKSTNTNCTTIEDVEERQKCFKISDPFMQK